MKKDDLLQDGLSRLESGESLEASQQELPEEESQLLQLAARLRSINWPERAPKTVNAQRDRLVEFYSKEMNMGPMRAPRFQFFKGWQVAAGLSAALVFILMCGLFLVLGTGALLLMNDRQSTVSEGPVIAHFEVNNISQVEKAVRNLASNQALLVELRGVVQIRQGEAWVTAQPDSAISVNSFVRTGPLSSAKLAFKDGSFVRLGPSSEISILALDIDRRGGPRQVELMQWSGESDHMVAKSQATDSRYEVKTPTGSGMAKGTQFQVRVSPGLSSWYVSEGAVDVSGTDANVLVEAGKMTSVAADETPEEPVFYIAGEGEVTATDPDWVIDGQTYLTDDNTVIIGDPQDGDIVFFQGHLLPDDQRMADLIVLIYRNPTNTFTLVGLVEEISDTELTVNEQLIEITGETIKDPADITTDDLVKVEGIILTTGGLRASLIQKLEDTPGIPFDIVGVVEEITGQDDGDDVENWTVSGISITVNVPGTTVQEGLGVEDLVRVQGWVLPDDGIWLADSISALLDLSRTFEFVGKIDERQPTSDTTDDPANEIWKVAGISFETRPWTEIEDDLEIGDLVSVKGQVLTDGTWVAFEIRSYALEMTTFLIGRVFSMPPDDPWVVAGVELQTDVDTQIDETIKVGMLVRVEISFLPDGTQKVISIMLLEGFTWTQGCQEFIVTVSGVEGNELQVDGWPNLPMSADAQVNGDLTPGSVVLIVICFDEDNNIQVTYIFVLESELPPTETPPTEEPPTTTKEPGRQEKVQVCHKPGSPAEKTLQVAAPAIPAHLGHGDTLGACGTSSAPNP